MQIYLIRHGMTQGNLERRYVGRTDEPLLPGEQERLAHMRECYPLRPDILFTSELIRCRQTAELLFGSSDTDRPGQSVICPGLNETDFGAFEYKNYEELKEDPDYQAWIDSGGTIAFPGGESGEAFRKRCADAFLRCMQDALASGAQSAAFVVHGGTIMAVMEAYCEEREPFYHWQVRNGCGYLAEWKDDGPLTERLRRIREISPEEEGE